MYVEHRELCFYFLGYLRKNGLLKRKRLSFARAIEIVNGFDASDDVPWHFPKKPKPTAPTNDAVDKPAE